MSHIKAMKQALEALNKLAYPPDAVKVHPIEEAKHILKMALLEDWASKADKQEPANIDFQKALHRAWRLGQNYWADADSASYSANKRADKHLQDFDALCAEALAYTSPPQRQPLTDKQWQVMADTLNCFITRGQKDIIEAALGIKEKT